MVTNFEFWILIFTHIGFFILGTLIGRNLLSRNSKEVEDD